MSNSLYLYILSCLGGLLLAFGWPPFPTTPFIFVGFVPLLFVENYIDNTNRSTPILQLFKYTYLTFLIWNALTTWWICNATLPAGIFAILANALLMCMPVLLFHQTKKQLGTNVGYASLIFYWLGFEYLHHEWELTWTWLTLGNGLSVYPQIIQWYEFTGTFGGSLWVLGVNIFLFFQMRDIFKCMARNEFPAMPIARSMLGDFVLIIFPILISVFMYVKYEEKKDKEVNVTVIQPNIDPYNDKFQGMSEEKQLKKLVSLSAAMVDSTTDYLVWPETAFGSDIYVSDLDNSEAIQYLRSFLKQYPHITLVSGINAVQQYSANVPPTPTARKYRDGECCYDVFNSAIQIDNTEHINIYHKSKLVPGVERMPYPALFKFLEPLAINLGGTFGSLATQEHRTVFFSRDSVGIAPVICFESIFADYVTEYIRNGAQAIFVVTNDGWWKDTPGYQQHLLYGRLRAIENRKDIARSANTGISCFINQRGDILQPTVFWKDAAIKGKVNIHSRETFFSRHGDYIGRTAAFMAVLLILLTFVSRVTEKFKYRINKL